MRTHQRKLCFQIRVPSKPSTDLEAIGTSTAIKVNWIIVTGAIVFTWV